MAGAPFAGGGIVENLEFGETIGLGGHFGYRFESSFSTFLSYQHARGSIGWDAVFPLISAASSYQGDALSNTVMVNVGYDWALTEATFIGASAGVGLSVNTLSGVVETDRPSGLFLSDVKDHSRVSPAAQVALSVQHTFASGLELGLNAAVSYTGGFDTGDTRVGNLGITAINPYRIDDVWRAGLGASLPLSVLTSISEEGPAEAERLQPQTDVAHQRDRRPAMVGRPQIVRRPLRLRRCCRSGAMSTIVRPLPDRLSIHPNFRSGDAGPQTCHHGGHREFVCVTI